MGNLLEKLDYFQYTNLYLILFNYKFSSKMSASKPDFSLIPQEGNKKLKQKVFSASILNLNPPLFSLDWQVLL